MEEDQLILVDETDTQIGVMGKLAAHQKPILHRAFSICILNDKGELMLQKRAMSKYHCGGFWTNTCCGHPRDGEVLSQAAHRRLGEEMGFDCTLKEIFTFHYTVAFDNGLWENEMNHVFIGRYNGNPTPNPDEADGWKWVTIDWVLADIREHPGTYTYWFKEAFKEMEARGMDLSAV